MTDLEALYSRNAPDVFRFALYLSGSHDEAADLTSETFVRAWASHERIRLNTVRSYLFTITRNLYLNSLRRSRRQDELSETLRDPRPGPAVEAERTSQLAFALDALMRLPEIDRAALVLRAVEDMPYDEIARTLGMSLATVKVRIHRARRALLEFRDAQDPDVPPPGGQERKP